ncbi:protein FIZZY-RELATED 3-like [Brachypodium distachyon]|uniref:protein FIZZY-RELATED 3-like n=1 Tax=Brachypodium distachyon TaxID=15368 RepID=UPI000D0CB36F|nr:protein FIZZY-RELATED 3-like [Brachypodium distachyon]|eukprot:XP_024312325.1 protein FIZZY-RELATED 3-like [Brachypodium distachyon]
MHDCAAGSVDSSTPKKLSRKVLDASCLQDDFYLNLVDWSSQNMLVVGIGTCVYLWSASSSKEIQSSLLCVMLMAGA